EQGRTTAVGAELGLEHTATDGDRFFLHAVPSSRAYPSTAPRASAYWAPWALSTFLRVRNCGMVAPCHANTSLYPDVGSICPLPRTTPHARRPLSGLSHRWGRGGDAGCHCRARRGSHDAHGVQTDPRL